MAKVQLLDTGGRTIQPTTKLAYMTFTSSGGIKFTSSTNTLTTSKIPIANVSGLNTSLNNLQDTLSAGFGMVVSGATVGQVRYFTLQPDVTAGSVTLSAGCGYHIVANGAVVTLQMETSSGGVAIDGTNQYGLEGHAMIYLTNSAYLKTGAGVIIGSPLTNNMYNNCTLRFHDGHCIIDVEDTKAPA